jgi:TPP-dependent pyruvate/acetoin dehydrogenase alpha subunit
MSAGEAVHRTISDPDPVSGRNAATLLRLLEQMWTIRLVERAAERQHFQGLASGPFHSSAGQEAVAVGACSVLRPDDYVWSSYRGHHHFLAKGGSPEACLAELVGRDSGVCRGLGGSMHLTDASHHMMGSYAIVGAQVALACGSAWSARIRRTGQVSLAFHGDGATNIGVYHEAMNLAAVWRLPVVFICENNLYMEYTPIAKVTSVPRPAADRAPANGIPAAVIDGNDVGAVADAVGAAVARARHGDGPSVVEALTYRHGGHAASDPARYRPAGEKEAWLDRDPLLVASRALIDLGVSEADVAAAGRRAGAVVDEALAAALAAGPARPDVAARGVWADGTATWRT